ncbi:MAG: hypothetical protein NZ524_03210 [Thiobacillaceae bacterium]|nr:hypothetical protein [Thiobacillaceae bacterium]MCX7673440.1 hypothetical protein [Thiobacillaceae bacterium]MDW8323290.1 hypothetical protein [Burkholderiales bacterium]
MIGNVRQRRITAVVLAVLGGVLLLLAPEDFWIGALLVAAAIVLELLGAVLAHPRR